jgi:DNA-binding CsgD family transcriptional regulator
MAERVGIAVNTFNTHLKNVFGKTNTHRQADLLKLLLALAVD